MIKLLENERALKDNNQQLIKKIEDLERENTWEKALRLKLEEEFRQNTQNHEDEVKLRLQFEAKLNHIHSLNWELRVKNLRCQESEKIAIDERAVFEEENKVFAKQIAELR